MAPYRLSLLSCETVMDTCAFKSRRGHHFKEQTMADKKKDKQDSWSVTSRVVGQMFEKPKKPKAKK